MTLKYRLSVALLGFAAAAAKAQPQSMPDMPGMPMPARPAPPARPKPKPAESKPSQTTDPAAAAGAPKQEDAPPDASPASPQEGANSITVPIQEVQEPEALGLHTGEDLPAPELLGEVAGREPMTLDAFLAMADRANPTLFEAQRAIDRSREQARQVALPPDPSVGYSAEHIRGGSYHGGEQGGFLAQTLVLGRKLALRRDVYRAEGRANQFALEAQRARVRNDVSSAFVDALAAQASVTIEDRLLKSALDAETNAHELERIGQADSTAVLNAEIAAEQAKVDFTEAQRSFLGHFARLASVAGQASLLTHPLQGALVAPPEMAAGAVAIRDATESPDVERAKAEVGVAEARLKSARREAVPNLTVKAGEWYSGEQLGALTQKAGWMSFAEAGVDLPLWNRNQGNVAAARAEVDRAQREVTRVQLWTREKAEPLAEQYEAARLTADRYRSAMLPRARRAYDLEVLKYQQMAQPYPGVLAAQQMLFRLQLGYIRALAQQWRAAVALSNFALSDGLDRPMSVGEDSTLRNLPTGGTE